MKVALYARVSTRDRDQNPETQLRPLREFVQAQGWEPEREYCDMAPANDLLRRKAWRELLDDGSKRKFDLLLVWRLDRAFRSVHDAANTLERLRSWGVGLRSYSEPWIDTTSPFGEALFHITVAYAQLERGVLRERVKAGMDRAVAEGKRLGRKVIIDSVDVDLVTRLRQEGKSWSEIHQAHPQTVRTPKGGHKRPGVGTIRRAWAACQNGGSELPPSGQEENGVLD